MAEFHIVSYEISNYNLYAIFFSILKIVDLVLLSIFIPHARFNDVQMSRIGHFHYMRINVNSCYLNAVLCGNNGCR